MKLGGVFLGKLMKHPYSCRVTPESGYDLT
jgi:hypothetical protein